MLDEFARKQIQGECRLSPQYDFYFFYCRFFQICYFYLV